MFSISRKLRRENKTVGFVPTMGALHEGHLSLVREARQMSDVVIVSIFVNPAQFGPGEDLDKYPRDLTADAAMLAQYDVDYVFAPETQEIYGEGFSTYVYVEGVTDGLEGASRPGHFRGVATVVTILFNTVRPDFAFFGQKDAQQVAVIKRLTKDLGFETEIVVLPIVRVHKCRPRVQIFISLNRASCTGNVPMYRFAWVVTVAMFLAGLTARAARVVPIPGSDHLGLCVDVALEPRKPN